MTDTHAASVPLRELELETVDHLPDRAAMALVNANLAVPINAALALNVLSDASVAYANAEQTTPIVQGLMTAPTL